MKESIANLEKQGYEGIDVSLETSLFEYGLAWKKDSEAGYRFIFGVTVDWKGDYNSFDWSHLSERSFRDMAHEEWFNLPAVLSFVGIEEGVWLEGFPNCVADAIAYHGAENILGGAYITFEIEVGEE